MNGRSRNWLEFDVFLSHIGENKPDIIQLAQFFEPEIQCWYAPRNILEGVSYSSSVPLGIEASKIFLVYLTEDYDQKEENYVLNEVIKARDLKKIILPVLKGRKDYPRNLEMHLNAIQFFRIDDFETIEEAYKQLQSIIQLLLNGNLESLGAYDIHSRVLHIPEGFIQMSEHLLRKYQQVLVPAIDFASISKDEPIHVFYGREQSGRTAHAIKLFLERGKEFIFESLTEESFQVLLNQPLHENAGYLIKADWSEVKAVLSETFLDQLTLKLQKAKAELILCTDMPVKSLENLEIRLPEDKLQVLFKHYQYFETDLEKQQQAKEILNQTLLKVNINEIDHIENLLEMVKPLNQVVEQEQSLDQFITMVSYLKSSEDHRSVDVYRLNELEDVFYNLAISLNQGKGKDSFIHSYTLLKNQYQDSFPNQNLDYHMQPFSKLLSDFRLMVKKERANQLTGTFLEDRIYYQNGLISKRIWPIVWEEYGYLHEFLANYLFQNIESNETSLLPQIEDAVFTILEHDIESGLKKLVNPMAKSTNQAMNQIAIRVLTRLYEQPKFKMKILLLLKNWIFSQNKRLELTALLTLQSKVGIENFKSVLEWLLNLYGRKCSYPQAFYISLLYLSKYIYRNEEFEKYYYRTLLTHLHNEEWGDKETHTNFMALIAKVFSNNVEMFFKSKLEFTEKFVQFIVSELANNSEERTSAQLLWAFVENVPENKNDKLKKLLKNVKEDLGAMHFQRLLDMMEKG